MTDLRRSDQTSSTFGGDSRCPWDLEPQAPVSTALPYIRRFSQSDRQAVVDLHMKRKGGLDGILPEQRQENLYLFRIQSLAGGSAQRRPSPTGTSQLPRAGRDPASPTVFLSGEIPLTQNWFLKMK